jgi:hypothetical protein
MAERTKPQAAPRATASTTTLHRTRTETNRSTMAAGGDDTTIAQVHSGIDSSNKTLLKSEALYKVRIHACICLPAANLI